MSNLDKIEDLLIEFIDANNCDIHEFKNVRAFSFKDVEMYRKAAERLSKLGNNYMLFPSYKYVIAYTIYFKEKMIAMLNSFDEFIFNKLPSTSVVKDLHMGIGYNNHVIFVQRPNNRHILDYGKDFNLFAEYFELQGYKTLLGLLVNHLIGETKLNGFQLVV